MTGHRRWTDIRNAAMDEPVNQYLRAELRRANDVALELGRLRDQHDAIGTERHPIAEGSIEEAELAVPATECLTALRESIEDLGGRLEIVAVFPDQRVRLIPESCDDPEVSSATT